MRPHIVIGEPRSIPAGLWRRFANLVQRGTHADTQAGTFVMELTVDDALVN